jgi:hypothetical protein
MPPLLVPAVSAHPFQNCGLFKKSALDRLGKFLVALQSLQRLLVNT